MNGHFQTAAIAIFIAMVLDGLDGRVARLTNTQSAFGEQYDSLADMVSFGVAPALIVYEWSLKGLGKLGWLAAFVYVAGAALRLARFNANISVVDKRFFQGMPSPAAAALGVGKGSGAPIGRRLGVGGSGTAASKPSSQIDNIMGGDFKL
jgi:CDP-diacylglycerol--serine O-phosphatidyltransferase